MRRISPKRESPSLDRSSSAVIRCAFEKERRGGWADRERSRETRRAFPLPPGEGTRQPKADAPGEGPSFMESVPHPALRATFSRREKVSRSYFAFFVQSPKVHPT